MKCIESLFQRFKQKRQDREQWALTELKARYHAFRIFLENNGKALELIVSLDGQLHRAEPADIRATVDELLGVSSELVDGLNLLADDRYEALYALHGRLGEQIHGELRSLGQMTLARKACIGLDQLESTALLQAGAKAVNLARLRQMGLPVPNGFACTVRACKNFLHSGQLAEQIRPLLRDVEIGRLQTEEAAAKIRELILQTPLPPEVTIALFKAYEELAAQERAAGQEVGQLLAVSVRSSGAAEDGVEHSFAGQFTSLLNIRGQESLLEACRRVIASGFSARAIAYRINAGLAPFDFDLAVLVQVMVPAETAGVLFTVDPSHPESGRMLISAVPGLGTTAVGGEVPADIYRPLRSLGEQGDRVAETGDEQAIEQHIARKTQREVPDTSGGLRKETVPEEEAEQPLLSEELLAQLVAVGRTIESMEGMAQDVEWACTRGSLRILQTRPLRLSAVSGQRPQIPTVTEPLCTGFCASAGKAVGRVRLIHSIFELHRLESELPQILAQAPLILALPHSIVDAARFLPHCAGILVDMGNPTDHLACVARECGVPMMTGVQSSLANLEEQQWLLVDADHGLVLEAPDSVRQQALQSHQQRLEAKQGNQDNASCAAAPVNLSPVRQSLRNRIIALNLTDAYGPTFTLAECRSIHDIIRYTHEMAVLTMFSAGDQVIEDAGGLLRPMEIGVPFSFLVIDLGGGIRRRNPKQRRRRLALRRTLGREDVLSVPLAALCDGMTTPGLRWYAPSDIDALPEVFSRTMLDNRGVRPVGAFNYALTARDYLNLNARVEFHFVMVDAVCGRDSHANYIRFRFKGGGAGLERSSRRAIFFQHVLEHNGFYTTVVGDLVTASLTGADKERIKEQLVMIGRLFGFSRFLDGMMSNDTIPLSLAKAFLGGQFDSLAVLTALEKDQA
ncbi:MAG: PEP/pyruvate-binding domain-containing protein [Desulfobulbus sp.]